jgi:hypothetical protein
MINKFCVSGVQPLPISLAPVFPVNHFLFVEIIKNDSPDIIVTVSSFHNTESYQILPFYKAISNIL